MRYALRGSFEDFGKRTDGDLSTGESTKEATLSLLASCEESWHLAFGINFNTEDEVEVGNEGGGRGGVRERGSR